MPSPLPQNCPETTGRQSALTRARVVLDAEAAAIQHIPLDDSFCHAVEMIYSCTGKVLTTGMGKAGNVARKIAGTLCSSGTPACFLHAGEAAHGDLGMAGPGDVILALSTSGKTREIMEMLDLAARIGVTRSIGITSHPDSIIRCKCTIVLNMGLIQEPCPLGLVPTASTTAMMALGDALSMAIMERRKFSRTDFGLRHHGGYLGQKARGEIG